MPAVPAIRRVPGREVAPWLDAVAALRIAVFREWPYLYEGDAGYEQRYLAAYAASPDSVFVLAFDGDDTVGASTGLPLADDTAEFQAPFVARGIDPAEVFYCGESILRPEYRGLGLGHAFFAQREAHARALGRFRWTAFCAVLRDDDDPRRPAGARSLEPFWRSRGYERQAGMTVHLHWNEVGRGEVDHALAVWLRPLEAPA